MAMKRALLIGLLAAAAVAGVAPSARPARAADLCVASKPGCFSTIQAALGAAGDGDAIHIAPGTYAGGITIVKSVQLVGTSAASTVIRGGGPVVTIGDGVSKPTVSISRVTVTGGLNDSAGVAGGGGVSIPSLNPPLNTTGASVSISDSVISGNRAGPKATFDQGAPCGSVPSDQCAFANGGGIDNSGVLTVTRTRVSDNVAGSAGITSSASGGGIDNHPQGTLTLRHSVVSGNRAFVTTPNGRFTDGGGIVSDGVLTMVGSLVSGNSSEVAASVASSFFSDVEQEANAGGIDLADGSTTTITGSRISGNSVTASNTAGDVVAESGGIDSDGSLLLTDSSVDHNTVTGSVPASSGFLVEADGAGVQVQDVTTVRRSRVSHNSLSATSATGVALGSGGGFFNIGGTLTLEQTLVTANSAQATGVAGVNLGGGIANVQFGGPAPVLTLTDSLVAANRLTASPGIASQGGGIFTLAVTSIFPFATGEAFPVALTRSLIAGNRPDQCVDC
jgi:hypothetical protein